MKTDASLGGFMKIRQTPTFYINGRKVEGGLVPAAMDGLIRIILNEGAK